MPTSSFSKRSNARISWVLQNLLPMPR